MALNLVDRRRDRLGVRFQDFRLFHAACRRLQLDAFEARQNVEMQVKDHLAAGLFVELLHRDAVGFERGLGRAARSSARV